MNRIKPAQFILIFLLFIASLSVRADALTDQTIQSFINSLKALQGMEDEFDELSEDLDMQTDNAQMPDMSRVFSSSIEQMKGHEAYGRLEDVVQDNGFSSVEQWAKVGDRISQAWTALEMEARSGQMGQEMARVMEEIDNNPHMTEEQKAQMRKMMGGAQSAMQQAANAPEADKQAVRRHLNELRSAFNEEPSNN